jgi:bla regulator protein blaR1
MIGLVSIVAFFLLTAVCSRAQAVAQQTPPSFEVASLKKHAGEDPPGTPTRIFMGGPDVSRFEASNVTVKMLIAKAYDVRDFQISGGPNWITSDVWDVEAKVDDSLAAELQKLPSQQQTEQISLMLRSLLADRFKLEITQSSKEHPALALVVAPGGAKLKPVSGTNPAASTVSPPPPPDGSVERSFDGVSIMNFVNTLSLFLGQPIVDRTGLKGTYRFTLRFKPPGPPDTETSGPDSNAPSIFTALQEQLGLKLESTKAPIEAITIDHIEEPTPD